MPKSSRAQWLVLPPLEIGERDGFEVTDLFGYEDFGERLARLVESLEKPSVIALDGPWGSGKTVFARQWAGLLRKRGSAVIYFDAFAADSGEDPLCDIASQLFAGASDDKARRRFTDATVPMLKNFGLVGAGVALRWVTNGVIGLGELQAFASDLPGSGKASANADERVSEAFRHRIEGARERERVISDFRKALESLAEAMKEEALENADTADIVEKDKESSLPRPLVVIIDELDRCKPTYALDLLEKIKHIFDAKNVCFVLVTNAAQLEKVVESQYGVKDASAYLDKFFQLSFVLPEAVDGIYIQHLLDEMLGPGHSPLRIMVEAVVSQLGVSLRSIERIVLHVAFCQRSGLFRDVSFPETPGILSYENALVAVVVSVVRARNANLYTKLRKGEVSVEKLTEFLGLDGWALEKKMKAASNEILRSAFPPQRIVDNGLAAVGEWAKDEGRLRDHVVEVCRWLDVVGPRPGPGR